MKEIPNLILLPVQPFSLPNISVMIRFSILFFKEIVRGTRELGISGGAARRGPVSCPRHYCVSTFMFFWDKFYDKKRQNMLKFWTKFRHGQKLCICMFYFDEYRRYNLTAFLNCLSNTVHTIIKPRIHFCLTFTPSTEIQ